MNDHRIDSVCSRPGMISIEFFLVVDIITRQAAMRLPNVRQLLAKAKIPRSRTRVMSPRYRPQSKNQPAFTLPELLLAVTLMAVLALLALSSLLETHLRARVAKTKNGLRIVAGAMEAYRADHGAYPPYRIGDKRYYLILTSPVAYLSSAEMAASPFPPEIVDGVVTGHPDYLVYLPYELKGRRELVEFRTPLGSRYGQWALLSFGPSRIGEAYDISNVPDGHSPTRLLLYDPTNGASSPGVIAWSQKSGML